VRLHRVHRLHASVRLRHGSDATQAQPGILRLHTRHQARLGLRTALPIPQRLVTWQDLQHGGARANEFAVACGVPSLRPLRPHPLQARAWRPYLVATWTGMAAVHTREDRCKGRCGLHWVRRCSLLSHNWPTVSHESNLCCVAVASTFATRWSWAACISSSTRS
jgi:hypothetical protein